MMETSTRSARNRRVIAILGWGILVGTAVVLWNGRLQSSGRSVEFEPFAFILAAFAAFVGVFAWLLFNPGRRSAAESPVLFAAATATLFPPPIIGFCLMPVDSPLRGWLTIGIFLLCVVAILSHVPDDFFGVPRGRSSYLTPLPTFDAVEDTVMNPDAEWFNFEDLGRILPDAERPSLSPRSYLQQEQNRPPTLTVKGQDKVATEVDDILGSDFDLGLLDDDFTDLDRSRSPNRHSDRSLGTPSSEEIRPRNDRRIQNGERTEHDDRSATRRSKGSVPPRKTESQRQSSDSSSVFSSFEQHKQPKTAKDPYRDASSQTSQELTRIRRKRRFAAPGKTQATRIATSIRQQASRPGRMQQRATGSGLASRTTGSSSALNQSQQPPPLADPNTTRSNRRKEQQQQSDELSYGTLDVHRGQQPQRTNTEDQQTPTTRRQTSPAESKERTSNSTSSRVSRFERQREQADQIRSESQNRGQDNSRGDRKLSRKSATEKDSNTSEPKRRRSALDIATAGIMGAGLASDSRTSATESDSADLDDAASQGLFSSVRDLFSKPKKATESEQSGAEAFESAVESVQQNQPIQKTGDLAIERTVDASGVEMVEGVAVVRFDRGQKKANVHIPFSPPLKGAPEVDVETVDGEQIRLKVPMAQPYGVRIEARRSDKRDPMEAEISFAAMAEEES